MSTKDFQIHFQSLTPSLNSFAMNLTKNREEAEDLYQETAFRAYTNRDKFDVGTNFKAWLFTIMKNIFINNYRRRVKMNTIMDSTDNDFYINSGANNNVGNDGDASLLLEELNTMIDGLDGDIKQPFMMHFTGFKYQEIADQLMLPLGTVKSRIFFARKAMKELILKNYGSYDMVKHGLAV
jgi:RNA polymerase sigma-70 factor, ECF subfamily